MTTEKELWEISDYLAKVKRFPILTKSQISNLRDADEIEIAAGNLREYKSNEMKENF